VLGMTWTDLREWINRNDGRWIRVDNQSLAWHQVLGGLLFVGGLLFYLKLGELFAIEPRWAGLIAMVGGFVLLSIARSRVRQGDEAEPEDQNVGPA
jgi:hypothetical protein